MAKANNTTTTTPEDTATVEGVRVEQVDPTTLLIDVNVRTETVADKDFIASVKDLGILQPIRAVRTPEGALRVETGHRRTLAAIEAGLATVPVLVVADEPSDDAGAVERIVRQYAENEHRTGLSTTDLLMGVAAIVRPFGQQSQDPAGISRGPARRTLHRVRVSPFP
jgi:ParB family transcriptional regulator, chromosome partitioning protein